MLTTTRIKKSCGHTVTQVYIGSGYNLPIWERVQSEEPCCKCQHIGVVWALIWLTVGCIAATLLCL